MGFKENLLKKIEIDRLYAQVANSLKGPDSGIHFDKQALQRLLAFGPYKPLKMRDLELYLLDKSAGGPQVLVLDNGVGIYNTTPEDVALRKSPTVKEMLSIRNAVKILRDSDVLVSKKEASLETIRRQCIDALDLTWRKEDISAIAIDGVASLESRYSEGVIEALDLFAELLGFEQAPRALRIPHVKIVGKVSERTGSAPLFGPAVLYSLIDNRLSLIEEPLSTQSREDFSRIQKIARGETPADREGADVFYFLKQAVLSGKGDVA